MTGKKIKFTAAKTMAGKDLAGDKKASLLRAQENMKTMGRNQNAGKTPVSFANALKQTPEQLAKFHENLYAKSA
jgi:hypothetical protein